MSYLRSETHSVLAPPLAFAAVASRFSSVVSSFGFSATQSLEIKSLSVFVSFIPFVKETEERERERERE